MARLASSSLFTSTKPKPRGCPEKRSLTSVTFEGEIPASTATSAGPRVGFGEARLDDATEQVEKLIGMRRDGLEIGADEERAEQIVDRQVHIGVGRPGD